MNRPSERLGPGLSCFLNLLRWSSAFAVVLGHVLTFLIGPAALESGASFPFRVYAFVVWFKHFAVLHFFVISGFLVGGSVLSGIRAGRFRWNTYLLNRLTRLYPVLLAALAVGALLDRTGLTFFNQNGIYADAYAISSCRTDVASSLTWTAALGNLAFLQTLFTPTFGSNGPLWSLAYEFWYYLLFPAALCLLDRRFSAAHRLIAGLFLLAAAFLLTAQVWKYFVFWLCGAGLWLLPWRPPKRLLAPAAFSYAAAAWLIQSHYPQILAVRGGGFFSQLILTILFSAMILALRVEPEPPAGRFAVLHERLAEFSYSLYVAHYPILLLAMAVASNRFGYRPGTGSGAFVAAAAVLALGLAYVHSYGIYLVSERHTARIRHFFGRTAPAGGAS